jgi:hypothetical protein
MYLAPVSKVERKYLREFLETTPRNGGNEALQYARDGISGCLADQPRYMLACLIRTFRQFPEMHRMLGGKRYVGHQAFGA